MPFRFRGTTPHLSTLRMVSESDSDGKCPILKTGIHFS